MSSSSSLSHSVHTIFYSRAVSDLSHSPRLLIFEREEDESEGEKEEEEQEVIQRSVSQTLHILSLQGKSLKRRKEDDWFTGLRSLRLSMVI